MKHARLPDWLAERAALDELPPAREREVKEILAREPEAREQLAELARSSEEILLELPPASVAEEVRRRAGATLGIARRSRRIAWTAAIAAAACLLLFFAIDRDGGSPGEETGAGDSTAGVGGSTAEGPTRAKGDPRLLLHRKRGERVELLGRTDRARAGDRIQISYQGGGLAHGLVLSIDGAGVVTLHFPESVHSSTRLFPTGITTLAHSYELDDAPGFERFLFLTSDRPIDVAAVVDSAEKLARDPLRGARDPLPLPPNLVQRWNTLLKESTP